MSILSSDIFPSSDDIVLGPKISNMEQGSEIRSFIDYDDWFIQHRGAFLRITREKLARSSVLTIPGSPSFRSSFDSVYQLALDTDMNFSLNYHFSKYDGRPHDKNEPISLPPFYIDGGISPIFPDSFVMTLGELRVGEEVYMGGTVGDTTRRILGVCEVGRNFIAFNCSGMVWTTNSTSDLTGSGNWEQVFGKIIVPDRLLPQRLPIGCRIHRFLTSFNRRSLSDFGSIIPSSSIIRVSVERVESEVEITA